MRGRIARRSGACGKRIGQSSCGFATPIASYRGHPRAMDFRRTFEPRAAAHFPFPRPLNSPKMTTRHNDSPPGRGGSTSKS